MWGPHSEHDICLLFSVVLLTPSLFRQLVISRKSPPRSSPLWFSSCVELNILESKLWLFSMFDYFNLYLTSNEYVVATMSESETSFTQHDLHVSLSWQTNQQIDQARERPPFRPWVMYLDKPFVSKEARPCAKCRTTIHFFHLQQLVESWSNSSTSRRAC